MTVKKARYAAPISCLAILVGIFINYKLLWAHGIEMLLAVMGFFLVVFGFLALAVSITRLLFPHTQDFGVKTLFDKPSFSQFKKAIGSKKAGSIGNTCTLLCFLLVGIIGFSFFTATDKYERDQLDKFGQVQKVLIKDIRYRKSRRAYFDFYFIDQTLTTRLYSKQLKVGDSAFIIFSTDNPAIVKWLDDYKKNKKNE